MNVGEIKQISRDQAAIILGIPSGQLNIGSRGQWAGMDVEVAAANGEDVQLRRVAFDSVPQGDTPTSSTDERFDELDYFGQPRAEVEKGGGGYLTKTRLGPPERKILQPGLLPGGEVIPKKDVFGPELKSPHPPFLTNPQFDEPAADYRALSSLQQDLRAHASAASQCTEKMQSLIDNSIQRGDFLSLIRTLSHQADQVNSHFQGIAQTLKQITGVK